MNVRYLAALALALLLALPGHLFSAGPHATGKPFFGQSAFGQIFAGGFLNKTKTFMGQSFARTELYFGSAKPDGSVVAEQEFSDFLDAEITPRFPDGLTLLTGFGQFLNSSGVILQQRSMLLILLYPANKRSESSEKIEEIRALYKQLFNQEAVLRSDRCCEQVGF